VTILAYLYLSIKVDNKYGLYYNDNVRKLGAIMATRKRNTEDHSQVKALNPRSPDTKYIGEEPLFVLQPDPDRRLSAITHAFTWYHTFYNIKNCCAKVWTFKVVLRMQSNYAGSQTMNLL
jgi:hypothetical protein